MHTKDFLSIKEFAAIMRVHPDTIRRAIKRGRISVVRFGGIKRAIYRIAASEADRMALCDMEKMVEQIIQKRLDNKSVSDYN
jgi:excisionase family DNA binding protein